MALLGPGNFGMHWEGKEEKREGRGLFARGERGGGGFSGGKAVRSSARKSRDYPAEKTPLLLLLRGHFLHCPKNSLYYVFLVLTVWGGNKCESALLHTERESV